MARESEPGRIIEGKAVDHTTIERHIGISAYMPVYGKEATMPLNAGSVTQSWGPGY